MAVRWRSQVTGIFGFAVCMVLLNLVGLPFGIRTLESTWGFLTLGWTLDDSWATMAHAAGYLIENPEGGELYRQTFFTDGVKFQYPPTSLFFPYYFLPTFAENSVILKYLSWIATVVILATSVLIFRRVRAPGKDEKRSEAILSIAGLTLLGLMFYPIMYSHMIGQVQTFLTAMFALLFYFWLLGLQAPAGAMLGLMCLIKPQYGLVLIWGVFRRAWGFVGAAVAVGSVGLGASIALFGLQNHLGYLEVLSYLSRHGEAFYPNQSMNGLLNRLLHNGDSLAFHVSEFAPYHPLVYLGSLAFALLLVLSAFLFPVVRRRAGSPMDLALISLAATIASPIAWEHHYGILFPIFALLFGIALRDQADGVNRRGVLGVLMASYLLCSTFLFGTTSLANTTLANVLMSYLFFGALMTVGVLFHLIRRSKGSSRRADRHPIPLISQGVKG